VFDGRQRGTAEEEKQILGFAKDDKKKCKSNGKGKRTNGAGSGSGDYSISFCSAAA
jgi:hypothetical protein